MQHTLRSRDFILLAYGVVCAAALFYYVSESVFGAVVFSPMGAGAVAIAIPLMRRLERRRLSQQLSGTKWVLAGLFFPLFLVALGAYHILSGRLFVGVGYSALSALICFVAFPRRDNPVVAGDILDG